MENQENQKEYWENLEKYWDNQKNQKKKMSSGVFWLLIICSVVVGLVTYNIDQKRQEKFDAAYEIGHELIQRESGGSIDVENATLHYNVPNGYVYSKENSTDNSKMYISEDCSRVLCVSFEEGNKTYTESDIDILISNNTGSGYAKSAETFGSNDFYVYTYSENSESDKNEVKPISVSRYVNVQDRYIICVTDILYVEESNSWDAGNLLSSLYFYETSKN